MRFLVSASASDMRFLVSASASDMRFLVSASASDTRLPASAWVDRRPLDQRTHHAAEDDSTRIVGRVRSRVERVVGDIRPGLTQVQTQ
ncbi:hypothetical protein ACWC09_33480, partial [Streptomyces sp. NPDC001617]